MSGQRMIIVFCLLLLLVAVAVGAWVVGSRIRSPAEVAAQTAPPAPTAILVEVQRRVLTSNIVTRGTGRFGRPQPISLAPSTLKAAAAGLITTLPLLNAQFQEGGVILTASGRPVFVLRGATPAYRDLVPGIFGNDVRQLEEALARLRFDPGPVDGRFDEQTSAAVSDWYMSSGWEPFVPTPTQLAHIRTLEQDMGLARKNKLAADASAVTAALTVQSARVAAELANRTADADVDAKVAAHDKAVSVLANAERAVQAAQATADHNNRVAEADLEAKLAVANSEYAVSLVVESALARADQANRAAAADVAARIADRALVVLNPQSLRATRASADAQLELARASAYNTRLEGELLVRTARRDANLASGQLELAEAALKAAQLEGKVAVQSAIDAQKVARREARIAEQQLALARTAETAKQLEGQIAIQQATDAQALAEFDVKLANEQVARLTADLKIAQAKMGVQVPVDELVFLPSLPVRVGQVTAAVGDAAAGTLIAVTDFQLSVDVLLDVEDAPYVTPGMEVAIDETALGIQAQGVVNLVAENPGTRGASGYQRFCEIRVTETSMPLNGQSLRVSIPVNSTQGEVLVVPASALTRTVDGTSRVRLANNDHVVVRPGLAAGGLVEVTPLDATLEPGQQVIVGYETPEPPAFAEPDF